MLGYADYVFTGTFTFEIVLKVTGSMAVCLRGLAPGGHVAKKREVLLTIFIFCLL